MKNIPNKTLSAPPKSWLMNQSHHLFECAWRQNDHSLIRETQLQDLQQFHLISPSISPSRRAKRCSCSHHSTGGNSLGNLLRSGTPVHSPGAGDYRQAHGDDRNTQLNCSWPRSSGSAHPTEQQINYVSARKVDTLCCTCHQQLRITRETFKVYNF